MIERHSIVNVAAKGRYTGKPRPWLVIQNEAFDRTESITLCLITHLLVRDAPMLRVDVVPSDMNGLRLESQVQIEKIATVLRSEVGQEIGRLENAYMGRVDEALQFFLAL